LLKETDLIEKADKIIVTSKNLLNRIYPKKGIVIENGANIKLFKCARKRMTKPKDLPTKGQWTIGYFGAVYEWFDVDLIKSLATELKGSNIIIIGDYLKEVKDKLSKYTNISLLGIKEHADLPQYLSHFDVCIIPFKKSRLNASINPIKVYEYLAGLKPVVATNLSEIKDYPYTYVSKSNSEFIKNVKIAAKAKVDSNKVDSFLAKRTWDSRINLFEKEINNMD
jgi:glycosyltransferase involved in cell wall biosynthesis